MKTPKLSELEQAAKPVHYTRVKDWLDKGETVGKRPSFPNRYDDVDALVGEILARFGWQTYDAWRKGDFSHAKLVKVIRAERHREALKTAELEAALLDTVTGSAAGKKGKRALANVARLIKTNLGKAR